MDAGKLRAAKACTISSLVSTDALLIPLIGPHVRDTAVGVLMLDQARISI